MHHHHHHHDDGGLFLRRNFLSMTPQKTLGPMAPYCRTNDVIGSLRLNVDPVFNTVKVFHLKLKINLILGIKSFFVQKRKPALVKEHESWLLFSSRRSPECQKAGTLSFFIGRDVKNLQTELGSSLLKYSA